MCWPEEDFPNLEIRVTEDQQQLNLESLGGSGLIHQHWDGSAARQSDDLSGRNPVWWARPNQPAENNDRSVMASFMEPSTSLFFRNVATHASFTTDAGEDPGGDGGGGGGGGGSRGMYSLHRTTLFSDSAEGEDIDLPFGSVNVLPKT